MFKNYRIKKILPCIANPEWIRIQVELDEDVSQVLPYLNSIIKGAVYTKTPSITFTKETKMITIYPKEINMAQVPDREDAIKTLEWLKELINDTWVRRHTITPSYERRELSARIIADRLPGTNCRACGLPSCFAFSMKLLKGEKSLKDCSPLDLPEHRERLSALEGILLAAGLEELLS